MQTHISLFVLFSILCTLVHGVIITSPPSVAGTYAAIRASFSAVYPPISSPITSTLVLANPCGTITVNVTGKIVFSSVDAGVCLYKDQADRVIAAGGIGLIMAKTTTPLTFVVLPMLYTASTSSITIPAVSMRGVDADPIRTLLNANVAVTASIGYTAAVAAEKQALLDMWTATKGSAWRFGATGQYNQWSSSTDPCSSWYGVVCNDTTGSVLGIALPLNQLVGSIPSSISAFSSIREIQLSANTGLTSFPDAIYEFPNLVSFEASGDAIASSISPNVGVMTKLRTLNLASNKMTGTIPAGFSQLVSLQTVQLNGNAFTGSIPSAIGNLNMVTQLSFSNNDMSGSVPSSIGGMKALIRLEIAHNSFGGDLPSSLTQLTNLTFLDISDNTFSGAMPAELTALTKLTYLNVAQNTLSGTVPDLSKATAMQVMDLSNNQFSGALNGSSFSSVLTALRAAHNAFTSIINFSTKKALLSADVSYNNLQWFSDIQALPKTTTSDINSGISGLTTIDLSHNQMKNLTALFDMSLENWPSLTSINLAYNQLGGALSPPTSVSTSQYLRTIDLSNNQITGTIPDVYGQLPNLVSMDLRNNKVYHASASLIPSFVTISTDTLVDYSAGNAYCPSFTTGTLTLYIDHSYHDYLLCQCKTTYRRNLGAVPLSCISCPAHLVCDETRTNDTTFVFEAGYYPTPSITEPEAMIECPNCMTTNSQEFNCQKGYSDRVCSKCDDGYFLRGKKCERCHPGGLILFVVILVIICLIIVYFAIMFSRRNRSGTFNAASLEFMNQQTPPNVVRPVSRISVAPTRRDSTASTGSTSSTSSTNAFLPAQTEEKPKKTVTLFKRITFEPSYAIIMIVINYTQTLSILCRFFSLDYSLNQLIGVAEVANVSGTGFGFECVSHFLGGTHARYLFTSLQPIAVTLFVGVMVVVGMAFIRLVLAQGYRWWLVVCGRILFFLLDFLFFPVLLACLSVFKCDDDPATFISYFTDYPHSKCNEIPTAEKAILLVVNLGGIYGLFISLLVIYRRTSSKTKKQAVHTMFGFFFKPYKSEYFYAGIIYLTRRFIFSILNGLLTADSLHLFISNMVFISVSILLVYTVRPFRRPIDNHFEIASYVALAFCYSILFVGSFTGSGIAKAFFWVGANVILYLNFLIVFVVSKVPTWAQVKSFIYCEWARTLNVQRYDSQASNSQYST